MYAAASTLDYVTFAVGAIGAVTGILAVTIQYAAHRYGGPRIVVQHWFVGRTEDGATLKISAYNEGRLPVTVKTCALRARYPIPANHRPINPAVDINLPFSPDDETLTGPSTPVRLDTGEVIEWLVRSQFLTEMDKMVKFGEVRPGTAVPRLTDATIQVVLRLGTGREVIPKRSVPVASWLGDGTRDPVIDIDLRPQKQKQKPTTQRQTKRRR